MATRTKEKPAAKIDPLSVEDITIREAYQLYIELKTFKEKQKRYDELRAQLLDMYNSRGGNNAPMLSNGIMVMFAAVDVKEYIVKARTDQRISFTRMVPHG
jgi:hypothetical protein